METRPVVNVQMNNNYQATGVAPPGGGPKSALVAYALWILGGLVGAHRFYLRRPRTLTYVLMVAGGVAFFPDPFRFVPILAWFLTIVGDLSRIPRWARQTQDALRQPPAQVVLPYPPQAAAPAAGLQPPAESPRPERPLDLQTLLLREAHRGDGKLTVTQGVMATGKTFEDVESCLKNMVTSGYVDVDNEPHSGVIVYVFPELAGRPRAARSDSGQGRGPHAST